MRRSRFIGLWLLATIATASAQPVPGTQDAVAMPILIATVERPFVATAMRCAALTELNALLAKYGLPPFTAPSDLSCS